jgi:hypothetical protein
VIVQALQVLEESTEPGAIAQGRRLAGLQRRG